jgi:hypothetical protein
MRKPTWIGLACAIVAGIAIYLTLARPSDEDRIKKTLSSFASLVSTKPNDTIISRTMRLRSHMKEVARDDVAVRVDELHLDLRGREKLEDEAAKVALVYQDAECTFIDTRIEMDPGKTMAKVDTTALVTAKAGGERKIDKRPVHLIMRNDGGWLIDSLDVGQPSGD